MERKKALLFGATGLIGRELLTILLDSRHYDAVIAVVRKPLKLSHPKLTQHVVDFAKLGDFASAFQADDVFCCLGTTIRKAGSQEAFAKVDVEYPLAIARLTEQAGARHMAVVSSIGAKADSRTFYLRMKGQMEEGVRRLGPPSVHAFRPSFLLGEREEVRTGEQIASALSRIFAFLLAGPLRKYKPIPGRTVALAMHNAAQRPAQLGFAAFESDEIGSIALQPS
ncbi:oxidoreductase [Paenibacillus sp. MBLB4367]|uniref:oxidoreductase n=1 Tax=Paenibacillus sp. MBLB4367 TaxID=3384767 RepID=UPI003908311C